MGVTVRVPGRDSQEGSRHFQTFLSCTHVFAVLTALGTKPLDVFSVYSQHGAPHQR